MGKQKKKKILFIGVAIPMPSVTRARNMVDFFLQRGDEVVVASIGPLKLKFTH